MDDGYIFARIECSFPLRKRKKKGFNEHRTQVLGKLGTYHGIFSSVLDEK